MKVNNKSQPRGREPPRTGAWTGRLSGNAGALGVDGARRNGKPKSKRKCNEGIRSYLYQQTGSHQRSRAHHPHWQRCRSVADHSGVGHQEDRREGRSLLYNRSIDLETKYTWASSEATATKPRISGPTPMASGRTICWLWTDVTELAKSSDRRGAAVRSAFALTSPGSPTPN